MSKDLRKFIVIVVGLIFFEFVAASLLYDYQENQNCTTMISGLWSAAATAAVGGIAFRQNKKYKQLADQQNDLAFMPDMFISTALSDAFLASTSSWPSKVRGTIDNIETFTCAPITLWFQKGPILNLKVVAIQHEQERWTCSEIGEMSFRDESKPIRLIVDIPKKFAQKSGSFTAILQYENIYGTKYQKEIDFTIKAGSTTPDISISKRATRLS